MHCFGHIRSLCQKQYQSRMHVLDLGVFWTLLDKPKPKPKPPKDAAFVQVSQRAAALLLILG